MSAKNHSRTFINRTSELEEFRLIFCSESDCNTALLLSAPSGRGKSAFTFEFGHNLDGFIPIRVDLPADKVAEDSGSLLILQIASCLNELAQSNKFKNLVTLEEFSIKQFPSENDGAATKKLLKLLGDYVTPLAGTIGVSMVEAVKEHITNNNKLRIEDLYPREQFICQKYCQHCFSLQDTLLTITNVQYCDAKTLDFIKNTGKIKTLNIILEYTNYKNGKPPSSILPENDILSLLEATFDQVIKYHLKPLEWGHIKEVLCNKGQDTEEVAKRFYESKDYNIREIVDYSKLAILKTSSPTSKNNLSASTALLCELRFEVQMVAACIAAHNSRVEIDVLQAMLSKSFRHIQPELIQNIKTLSNLDIIDQSNISNPTILQVSHDHVSEMIRTDRKLSKSFLLACKGWIEFYKEILENENFFDVDKITVISRMINLCVISGMKDHLPSLIKELEKYTNNGSFPMRVTSHLISIAKESSEIYIQSKILNILYKTGLIAETYEVLNTLSYKSPTDMATEAMVLHRLGKYKESNNICNALHKKLKVKYSDSTKSAAIILKLIESINMRGLHKIADGKRIYLDLLNDESLKTVYEYGLVLRQSAIFFRYSESIPFIKRSIKWFEDRSDALEEAYSRLTYAMQLTRLGDLEEASNELDKADKLLPNSSSDKEVIWNNRAVIDMFSNKVSTDTKYYLQQASSLTRDRYRFITGTSNLYVYEAFFEHLSLPESKSDLEVYLKEHDIDDKYLPLICYYNFMMKSDIDGNHDIKNTFKNKIDALNITVSPLWHAFLTKNQKIDNDMDYMVSKKWMLGFFPLYHFSFSKIDDAFDM